MNRQYGTDYISVMPTNLYGPNDNYHRENAHVLPMLLRRFHDAKIEQQASVIVWGTGNPRREFMYVDEWPMPVSFSWKIYQPKTSVS